MQARLISILVALGTIHTVAGQDTNFSVPALGYVHDRDTRSLRPIRGVLGAATFGAPLSLPFSIAAAVVAPRLDYALAKSDDRTSLVLIRGLGGEPGAQELLGVPAGEGVVALANNGRAAASYSAAAASIHVLTGLPEQTSIRQPIDTGGSPVRAIAVSDTGRFVAAAFENGEASTVVRVYDSESGAWRELGPASRVTALAFAPSGTDLAVTSDSPSSVSIIRDVAGAAEWRVVSGEADAIVAPSAVRFAGDSGLWIAGASGVTHVQLTDNARLELRCACKPTVLAELESGSMFRLTELSREPMWVLQQSDEGPKLLFIPPPAVPESSEGNAQ